MITKNSTMVSITERAALTGSPSAAVKKCMGRSTKQSLKFRVTRPDYDVSGSFHFCRIITRGLVIGLMATILVAGSRAQSPQPEFTLDLKPFGFIVDDAIQNNTTLGFFAKGKVGVHIDQCQVPTKCKNRLLIIDTERKVVGKVVDLPHPVRFIDSGRLLYFSPNHLDLYDADLRLLASYTPPAYRHLDFAARAGMVQLSPDGLRVSIPAGAGMSQILDTENLALLHNVQGAILALSQNRWFVRQGQSTELVEQVASDHMIRDIRHIGSNRCPKLPSYLNSTLTLIEDCDGQTDVADVAGRIRYSIGRRLGSLAVVPDRSGDRFATELYVSKSSWNGTAQYSRIILRAFESTSGREMFHLQEVPSDQEPTFSHFLAMAPDGSRLATIFGGVLRIYDLETTPAPDSAR